MLSSFRDLLNFLTTQMEALFEAVEANLWKRPVQFRVELAKLLVRSVIKNLKTLNPG